MAEIMGKRVLNSDALQSPGDFCWYSSGGEGVYHTINGELVPAPEKQFAGIGYMCPCGCGREGCLYVYKKGSAKEETPGWEWDGNPDQPTLTPSIYRCKKTWNENCGWHGYLTKGVWISC